MRVLRTIAFFLYLVACVSIFGFLAIELFPGVLRFVNTTTVQYYAIKERYVPDPDLIFRHLKRYERSITTGDLSSVCPEEASRSRPWTHEATFTAEGFRSNINRPPYDAIVIGDSFVEIGEQDSHTVSEQIAQAANIKTLNLGAAWYGPHHYLTLLRRNAPNNGAKYILTFIFSGNDLLDIVNYERWLAGGSYYNFGEQTRALPYRYIAATRQILSALKSAALASLKYAPLKATATLPCDKSTSAGYFKVAGTARLMAFAYWNEHLMGHQLADTRPWHALRRILAEMHSVSTTSGSQFIVVLVPTKLQTYAHLVMPEFTSSAFLERLRPQIVFQDNMSSALAVTTASLGIGLLDLTLDFRALAATCLLFFDFDTHWTLAGRRVAAQRVAEYISGRQFDMNRALETCR
jgi:hypothetical protein